MQRADSLAAHLDLTLALEAERASMRGANEKGSRASRLWFGEWLLLQAVIGVKRRRRD